MKYQRQVSSWGKLAGQPVCQISVFVRRPCLKNKGGKQSEKTFKIDLCPPYVHMHMCAHACYHKMYISALTGVIHTHKPCRCIRRKYVGNRPCEAIKCGNCHGRQFDRFSKEKPQIYHTTQKLHSLLYIQESWKFLCTKVYEKVHSSVINP